MSSFKIAPIRRCGVLTALTALFVITGSAAADIQPPVGPGPLRYRDVVFPTLQTTPALAYGSAPDASGNPVTLTLNMYRPAGDTQTRRPAIVLVHGGGFVGGNAHNGAMMMMARGFAERGYVAVSINYRLLGKKGEKCGTEGQPSLTCIAAATAAQHDAQAAIRWLRRNATTYGVDPSRVAIGGGSAGAATALAVAVNSGDPGDSGNPGYSSKVGAAISISGALPGSYAKTLFDASDSPTLMFEGTADTTVPYAAAAQTASEMQKAHIPVVFEALQGGGHVPMKQFGTQIVSQSIYFAYDRLGLARAAGQHTAAPRATITRPRTRGTYRVGERVLTSYSCAEGNGGPGLASCRDSRGSTSGHGQLDTRRAGRHTYSVTATSKDGYRKTATITYSVIVPPLSRLSVSPRQFRAATHGGTLVSRGGLRIVYRDALTAQARFDVLRRGSHGRLTSVGSFTHSDRAGVVVLRFSGRLGGHTLSPASYVLRATATFAGARSRTVTANFQIVR